MDKEPIFEQKEEKYPDYLEKWGAKEVLEKGEIAQLLLPELGLGDFLRKPEMIQGISDFVVTKKESLEKSLKEMGKTGWLIPNEDWQNMQTVGKKVALLSVNLLKELSDFVEHGEKSSEEKVQEIKQAIGKDYGLQEGFLNDLVDQADITGKIEERTEMPLSEMTNIDKIKDHLERKVLIDLYVQGKSLNSLGYDYSYHCQEKWQDAAIHRAMGDVLHLTNILTVIILARQGQKISQLGQQQGGIAKLGHLALQEEEKGYKIKANGMNGSELMHEITKGLLEYIVLDTSNPSKKELSEEEAELYKNYLERPSVEMFELIYGPTLAKKVDQTIYNYLKSIRYVKNNEEIIEKLAGVLRLEPQKLYSKNNDANILLRIIKVISMFPKDKLIDFYRLCLKEDLPAEYYQELKTAQESYEIRIKLE